MKKILIISATPRQGGNSDMLADRVAMGALARGAQVKKVNLRELDLNFCKACDACQQSRETFCVQQDDMGNLYADLLQSDVIVFATPIYFFTVSGQMKVLLDRTYALGGGDDWTALKGKKAAMVLTYADANPLYSGVNNAYRMFKDAFEFLQIEEVGCLHASCGAAGEIAQNTKALDEAHTLGWQIAE
jgi:multimeric flavodoxin WrbA